MIGVRKFNRAKEVEKHYKAIIKSFKDGNIESDEMDEKLTEVLTYAEEHEIEFDVEKMDKYRERYGKRKEDYSFWNRWIIP